MLSIETIEALYAQQYPKKKTILWEDMFAICARRQSKMVISAFAIRTISDSWIFFFLRVFFPLQHVLLLLALFYSIVCCIVLCNQVVYHAVQCNWKLGLICWFCHFQVVDSTSLAHKS